MYLYGEVIEPSNIAGVKIIRQGNELRLENSNLNLTKIYSNYEYISENALDLSAFIEDYKKNTNQEFEEKENEIVLKAKTGNLEKELYIDKKTGNPTKMNIKDNNRKSSIYILYNEVKLNKRCINNIYSTVTNFTKTNILKHEIYLAIY